MPRSQVSQTGRIVNFFRTADLPVARLVLDLCKDAVTERTQKSEAARARATTAPTPRVRKAAPAKRKATRRRTPVSSPLPLGEVADAGDAGDA